MTDVRRRTRALYRRLTPRERAVTVLRDTSEGARASGTILARLTMPSGHRNEVQRWLRLARNTDAYAMEVVGLLRLGLEGIEAQMGWIAVWREFAAAGEAMQDYLTLADDLHTTQPRGENATLLGELGREIRTHIARVAETVGTDDSPLLQLQDTLGETVTDAWAMLMAIEHVAAEVARVFDETDVLSPLTNDHLASIRKRLESAGAFIRRWHRTFALAAAPSGDALEEMRERIGLLELPQHE